MKMRNANQPFSFPRSLRLRGYDYRSLGVYFVTLCTHEKRNLFGSVIDGEMFLSKLGELARQEWRHIAKARSNVELDRYVIMPNHIHGLIIITDRLVDDSGQRAENPRAKHPRGYPAGSLGAIISLYKAGVSRRARSELIGFNQHIWQRNSYDHIVRDEESANEIRRYIIENPGRWHDDSLYVD